MFKLKIQCNTVKKQKPAAVFLPNMVPTYTLMVTPGVVVGEKKQPVCLLNIIIVLKCASAADSLCI